LRQVYQSVTRWIFILTLPLSYLFIFYPGTILALFGAKFAAGATVLAIVAFGYLFEYGTSATQVIINMTGKSWLSLINQLIYFCLVVLAATVLIPQTGLIGAAWAVTLGIIAINLIRLYQSYRIVGFLPYSYYLIKPIAAVFLAGLVLSLSGPLWLIVGYLVVYGLVVWGLGLDSGDKDLLTDLKRLTSAGAHL
jgi:O-antigen/teichoic acid export membrane protein